MALRFLDSIFIFFKKAQKKVFTEKKKQEKVKKKLFDIYNTIILIKCLNCTINCTLCCLSFGWISELSANKKVCTSLHHKLHSLHPEKNNGLLWTFGGGGHERISQSFTQSYWNKKNRVIYLNMFIILTHLLCIYTAASLWNFPGSASWKKKQKWSPHGNVIGNGMR